MKNVKYSVLCKAYYTSSVDVPDDLTKEEILDYINDNLETSNIGDDGVQWLEDIPNSVEIISGNV